MTTIAATERPATAIAAEVMLFLPQGCRAALPGLVARVSAALCDGAAGFRRLTGRRDAFVLVERGGRRVLVALCPEPVGTADLTARAPDRASVARLRDHCACLSVSVRGGDGALDAARDGSRDGAGDDDRLCAEVVARLVPLVGADLVHWVGTGRLQRAEELTGAGIPPARRPTTRTPRPVLVALQAGPAPDVAVGHPVSRIGRAPDTVPRPRRPAELRATLATGPGAAAPAPLPPDLIRARARAQAEAVFPPLAPADGDGSEEDLKRTRFAIYGDGGPQFGDRDAPAVQRLSVYALNMSLIVAAAPVGALVLAANMVFGENMRLTSHALALTGVSVGTDLPERALALLARLL